MYKCFWDSRLIVIAKNVSEEDYKISSVCVRMHTCVCAAEMLTCLPRMLLLHLVTLFSDREAVQELDAHLKETRKSAGEKVSQVSLAKYYFETSCKQGSDRRTNLFLNLNITANFVT